MYNIKGKKRRTKETEHKGDQKEGSDSYIYIYIYSDSCHTSSVASMQKQRKRRTLELKTHDSNPQ